MRRVADDVLWLRSPRRRRARASWPSPSGPSFERERSSREACPLVLVAIGVQNPGNLGGAPAHRRGRGRHGRPPHGGDRRPLVLEGAPRLDGQRLSPAARPRRRARGALDAARGAQGLAVVPPSPRTAPAYDEADLRGPVALVCRQRGRRPAPRRRGDAHARVSIPLAPPVESLNVASPPASCSSRPRASGALDPGRRGPLACAAWLRAAPVKRSGSLFPEPAPGAPPSGRLRGRRSARRTHSAAHPRRDPGPGRGARSRQGRCVGPSKQDATPLADPLGPAGLGQDHPGPRRAAPDARPLRSDERRALGGEGAAGGPAGGRGPAPPRGPAHGRLHRRDPPLQQGPAGRAPGPRRVGGHRPHRGHHREPVVRGERGAALPARGSSC